MIDVVGGKSSIDLLSPSSALGSEISKVNPRADLQAEALPAVSNEDDFVTTLKRVAQEQRSVGGKSAKVQAHGALDSGAERRIEGVEDAAGVVPADGADEATELDSTSPMQVREWESPEVARKKSMLKFMASLESELGISPEAIVEAMQKLDPSLQAKPPEQTMNLVLGQLELEPSELARATELYGEMLRETRFTGATFNYKPPVENALENFNFKVLTKEQDRKRTLEQDLARISTEFFALPQAVGAAAVTAASASAGAAGSGAAAAATASGTGGMPGSAGLAALAKPGAEFFPAPAPSVGAFVVNGEAVNAFTTPDPSLASLSPEARAQNFFHDPRAEDGTSIKQAVQEASQSALEIPQGMKDPSQTSIDAFKSLSSIIDGGTAALKSVATSAVPAAPVVAGEAASGAAAAGTATAQGAEAAAASLGSFAAMLAGSGDDTSAGGDGNGESQSGDAKALSADPSLKADEAFVLPGQEAPRATQPTMAKGMAAPVTGPGASMSENASKVQDLVQRAQILVKQGGGAMNVQMHPEGLGKVELRVDVVNGNVNISMVAEHSEAKKVLENGIGELKHNLLAQKLNVNEVKVDVSPDTPRDFGDRSSDAEKTYSREFMRDFMGQMRDQNQSSRQGFMNTPSQRYFDQRREDVEPAPVEPTAAAKSAKKSRLHLVG